MDKGKKKYRIIQVWILILLGVFAFTLIRYYLMVRRMTENKPQNLREYSVLALKSSSYQNFNDLNSQTIGLMQSSLYADQIQSELRKSIDFSVQTDASTTALMQKLTNQTYAAIVLESAYVETLQEEQETLYNNIRVIHTFKIVYEAEETQAPTANLSEPFIVYISGSDSRGSLSEVGRSDVNMLVVVNPKTTKVLLVSVPRDYYVQLHGTTGIRDKLTHAGVYSLEMSKNTMGDIFGVTVDHTVKIGFDGLRDVVDAIGGIEVNSDTKFTAHTDNSCKFVVGINKVDGACALAYTRERYAYTSGDRHRIENQQEVLGAIIDKIAENHDLFQMLAVLNALGGELVTSFSYDNLIGLVQSQISESPTWQIEKVTVDGTGSMQSTYSMGSQLLYVMIPDQRTVEVAKAKIADVMSEE